MTFALADESLRAHLATEYPEMWARITARRVFMADKFGINLHADVLPLSNMTGYLPPFLLRPDLAMTLAELPNGRSILSRSWIDRG